MWKLQKLENDELHSLYRSPNVVRGIKSRRLNWAGYLARMEEGAFKILRGKPIGKILAGRPRHRKNEILKEILNN